MMKQWHKTTLAIVAAALLGALGSACKKDNMRVARWALAASSDAAGQTRSGYLSKGERVEFLRVEGDRSLVRLADGKEVFVESKNLFIDAGVIQSSGLQIYQRPSATSGAQSSSRNIKPGVVFFVKSREKNAEGEWLQVEGGASGTYFAGWLLNKEGQGLDFDVAVVSMGLRLETALQKKDRGELESLAGERGGIGEAAAAALAEMAPAEEAQDADGAVDGSKPEGQP
ncbi:MAG: hypothetical protein K1X75_02755 [Leptospirales bacterium]|nr:hypothetical protein [Leptospirales bacterium]